MPKVKPKETQSHYVSRCVKEVKKEGKNTKQALGKCYGMYRNKTGR